MADQPHPEPDTDRSADPLDAALGAAFGQETTPPPAEQPGSRVGQYKLLQQIGEGGMGTVFMAEQEQPVRRRVALKVIKAGMDNRQVIARFEAERQALALMDHPNIAKVFDAGTTDSGRPYFVMELVKGVPITKYCDEHKLTLRQRLELFVPVCQAVQHAHQKGIIHRDLKPTNVLVALYDGKPVPKVIDFGVAKATGSQLTDKTLFTDFGAVVGTLEYMSPEQVEVNQLDIDTRSDVYGLGVLLYELLTGTTPLERKRLRHATVLELLRLIREEEPPKPSTRLSTTEELPSIAAKRSMEPKKLSGLVRGDLDWIVMKCLEKDRNRRYETANGLAMDVQRYLADEPVLACPPSAAYRCRKFARRHKAGLRTAAAVALVLLLATTGVGWALWDRAAQREFQRTELANRVAETERTVSVSLGKAEQLRDQAAALPARTSAEGDAALVVWRQAEDTLAQAEAALSTGSADERLRQRVQNLRQQIEAGRGRDEQRRALALRKERLLRDLDDARMSRMAYGARGLANAGALAKYASTFAAYGLDVKAGPAQELARRIRAEEPAVRDALIVALDFWAHTLLRNQAVAAADALQEIARAADDDAWRQRYRSAAAAEDGAALRALSEEARRQDLPTSSLQLLALNLNARGQLDEALTLLRWARGRHPTDFWIHLVLGTLLANKEGRSPVELEEAIGCHRAALALSPDAAVAHSNLAHDLWAQNQFAEAIAECRKAIELDPKQAEVHRNLGIALKDNNQVDEAIAEFRKAIDLAPKLARVHMNLGNALKAKNQPDEAIAEFRKAIEIDPKDALPHVNFGRALSDKNQLDEAIAEFRKAIDLDPKDAMAHYNLGSALRAKNQLDDAIAEYRKAIDLGPKNAKPYVNLGLALADKNRLEEAIAEYRKAIDLDPKDAPAHYDLGIALYAKKQVDEAIAEFRKAVDLDPKLAGAHTNLGNALKGKSLLDEAIAEYRQAIDLHPKDAMAHYNLGIALKAKNQFDEAIAEFRKAIDLNPTFAPAHNNLGLALRDKNQLEEAIAEYRKAIDLDANYAPAHFNLGLVLKANNHVDEAIVEYRKAIDLDPTDAKVHYSLGIALTAKNQLTEGVTAYRKTIELQPNFAEAHCNLGGVLRRQGHFAEALVAFRRGHELGLKRPDWRYPSAEWVRRAEREAALEAKLSQLQAGEFKPRDNDDRLGLAGVCNGKQLHRAEASLYADAFANDAKFADDVPKGHRYNAACAAALAGGGQGNDADKLDDKERARLRKQALEWLRADLAYWTKQADSEKPADRALVQNTLKHWQDDTDLAGVRDPKALEKLPADEQDAWGKLWADVEALLKKARDATKQP